MGQAAFNRARRLAAAGKDSNLPNDPRETNFDPERERAQAEESERNKTRLLTDEERSALQNAHLKNKGELAKHDLLKDDLGDIPGQYDRKREEDAMKQAERNKNADLTERDQAALQNAHLNPTEAAVSSVGDTRNDPGLEVDEAGEPIDKQQVASSGRTRVRETPLPGRSDAPDAPDGEKLEDGEQNAPPGENAPPPPPPQADPADPDDGDDEDDPDSDQDSDFAQDEDPNRDPALDEEFEDDFDQDKPADQAKGSTDDKPARRKPGRPRKDAVKD